jgi:polyisoprenoid-binding protein YceI
MEETTLNMQQFPEVSFRSSSVAKTTEGQWKVDGDLTLHGVSLAQL